VTLSSITPSPCDGVLRTRRIPYADGILNRLAAGEDALVPVLRTVGDLAVRPTVRVDRR
jgi:hypothetical protein